MNYREIDWIEANDLISDKKSELLINLKGGCIQVYSKEGLYIVMSINPFGKALITPSRSLVDSWIEEKYFPTQDKVNEFYLQNKDVIDNLKSNIALLKTELIKSVDIKKFPSSDQELEHIYDILVDRQLNRKYALHYIVMLGDYLLSRDENGEVRWGLLRDMEFLNPVTKIVLVKRINGDFFYYDLETKVTGKWGFNGVDMLNYKDLERWKRTRINEVIDILE